MSRIKQSFQTGLGFGLTSGIITTLGLVVGLHSGTHLKTVIIAGIVIIAVADAMSDALGIHISEESDKKHGQKEIWEATTATLISKLIIALTFIIPILYLPLAGAIIVSIVWGLFLIGIFSFYIAKRKKENPLRLALEHLTIAGLVIIITHFLGDWLGRIKG